MKVKRITQAGALLLMLGTPVFIFVFFYLFGENHYELPHEGRYEITPAHDTTYMAVPVKSFPYLNRGKVHIVMLSDSLPPQEAGEQWQRLQAYFQTSKTVVLHRAAPDSLTLAWLCPHHNYRQTPFVLIDKQGFVRGHYGSDMEEYDRLITETLIAVKLP